MEETLLSSKSFRFFESLTAQSTSKYSDNGIEWVSQYKRCGLLASLYTPQKALVFVSLPQEGHISCLSCRTDRQKEEKPL
jgi:hypothetical protein